jgi:hypothetical protein
MIKKITLSCFLLLFFLSSRGNAYEIDRVVLTSVPTGRADTRIYLLADKISWMDYENFVIQVGEQAQGILYHFPDWYHGKYDTELHFVDVSDDKQKDIIVILNNDRAGLGKPIKDIHILNQQHDLLFKEAAIEPISTALNRLAKVEKKGNIVTVFEGRKKHKIDVTNYHFVNPRKPYFGIETMEYAIENGSLTGLVGVYVVRDDWVQGGLLGRIKVKYGWDGIKYFAKSITFKKAPDK